MKHALLITAYKDFKQLAQLVNEFDENFNIYIHIDKKSKVNQKTIQCILKNANVAYIETKYTVNWGGINHLKSYLLLSEEALKNDQNEYFHLITGQDYPLKNNEYFNELLFNSTDEKISYLDYSKMPALKLWTTDGGMGRLEYYNFYDLFNAKSSLGKKSLYYIKKLQLKLKFKRAINIKQQLYGGSTYWTLPRNTLQFVINFTEQNPVFFRRFKYTFCAEEIYFQTVIMNSEHAKNVINDNLRFIDWENAKDGGPAFLDESDYERIVSSNKLFARKIDSNKLKQMLATHKKQ
ncbi:MAG: hypothetical protein ACI865_001784 [Flavobacteriaceae bacterium]|jgi:hypothetical protein